MVNEYYMDQHTDGEDYIGNALSVAEQFLKDLREEELKLLHMVVGKPEQMQMEILRRIREVRNDIDETKQEIEDLLK